MKIFFSTLFLFFHLHSVFAQINNLTKELKSQNVRFIENRGQIKNMNGKASENVLFKVEAPQVSLFITTEGLTYCFIKPDNTEKKIFWNRVDLHLKNAKIKKENCVTEGKSESFSQYFLPTCPKGISNVHSFNKITFKNIYPEIDWVLYNSDDKGFKYDFIVHPNANPNNIELVYSSLNPTDIDENGNINVRTELGFLRDHAPISFQNEEQILSGFTQVKKEKNTIGGFDTHIQFSVGKYDKTKTLRIDPKLIWSTYLGGNLQDINPKITADYLGNIILTGASNSIDFPLQNNGGYFNGVVNGLETDVTIVKFNPAGAIIWSTYYGGSDIDLSRDISADRNGNILITGETWSLDFPTKNAGTFYKGSGNPLPLGTDAFILKFNNDGKLFWATYYGGAGPQPTWLQANNGGIGITSDKNGNIFVVGGTSATDFPLQNNGTFFQTGSGGAFILKFDATGNRLWATLLLQAILSDICCDEKNNIFVTGESDSSSASIYTLNAGTFYQATIAGYQDGVIAKFDNDGNCLWSTYCGGHFTDMFSNIICDKSNNIFIAGRSSSSNMTLVNTGNFYEDSCKGITDICILKFDENGNQKWGTLFGGSFDETDPSLALDSCNNLYLSFSTWSANIPKTTFCNSTGYNDTTHSWQNDFALAKFSSSEKLIWSTLLGCGGTEDAPSITVDHQNNLIMAGGVLPFPQHDSLPFINDMPGAYFDSTFNSGGGDIYIAKFAQDELQAIAIGANSSTCNPCNGSAQVIIDCGLPPFNYQWSNSVQTLQTDSVINSISGLCSGTYSVNITAQCGAKKTVQVDVGPIYPDLSFVNQITPSTCEKNNGDAHISVKGGLKPYTFNWTVISNTDSSAFNLYPNTYLVSVKDSSCIPLTKVDTIVVGTTPQPMANFSFVQNLSCDGITSTFINSSEKANTYHWYFGDGNSSADITPNYTYANSGAYKVKIIVQNGTCVDSLSKNIYSAIGSNLGLNDVNVFTPNNDTYNDCFSPVLQGTNSSLLLQCVQLEIYDRWGLKVFTSDANKKCWDGTNLNNKQNADDGTYYYIARFEKSVITGYVTLIR